MKLLTLLGLGLIPFAVAHEGHDTLGPAPTESYGCEPHGDHYHCEGHVSETAAQATTVASPTTTPDHDHDDHDHDHDHDEEDHDHDHDHDHESGSLPPSPTASVGCEPHGDHWHCDGPATATPTDGSDEATGTDGVAAQLIPLAGALAAVAFAL